MNDSSASTSVLLIDDNVAVLDSYGMLLEFSGYEIYTAGNGDEALAHINNGVKPAIVISDYRLPNYDGVELVKRIRHIFGDELPVIMLTGDTSATMLNSLGLKNFEVLSKPTVPKLLLQRIEFMLKQ